MSETEEILNEDGPALPAPTKARFRGLGGVAFGLLTLVCSVAAFGFGGFLSLGQEGVEELLVTMSEPDQNQVNRPTHEWIEIEKTIYQLNRREEAKYVLAKFTIRSPIENAEEVRRRLPELEFALQTYIRELSSRELQGAMGLYNLRNACLFRARRILGRDAVDDILIGELLVE